MAGCFAKPKRQTIAELRTSLAAALAFSARKLWRRSDLASSDQQVLEFVTAALSVLGKGKHLDIDKLSSCNVVVEPNVVLTAGSPTEAENVATQGEVFFYGQDKLSASAAPFHPGAIEHVLEAVLLPVDGCFDLQKDIDRVIPLHIASDTTDAAPLES